MLRTGAYAIFVMDGRAGRRATVPTDEEGAELFGSMVAYAGTFTHGEGKIVHPIDVSWNQTWTGTNLVRFYKLDDDTLTITTANYKSFVDGQKGRLILVWNRIR